MTVDWRALQAAGFSCFPLRPRDKRPSGEWKAWQERHPTEEEIARWEKNPSLNAAVVCGAISNIIVLDTDSLEADGEVQRRGVPATVTARTGKGKHYYFRHPGFEVGNFVRRLPGCDLRGDGGYVVAPGSVHPSGAEYKWIVSPDEGWILDPPTWLLELLRPGPAVATATTARGVAPAISSYGESALDAELAALRRAAQGQRNHQLNKSAFSLGQLVAGGLLDRSTVERYLLATALAIGLGEKEARATIASGLESGAATPRGEPEEMPRRRRARSERGAAAAGAEDDGGDDRPTIRVIAGRLHEAVDALDNAFGAAGSGPVFQRGGELVHVTRRPARRDDEAVEQQEAIAAISPAALRAAASRITRFERFDSRADEFRPIDPPKPVIEAFMGAPQWHGIADIGMLIGAPLLRQDGSLLAAPGYDPATGFYLTKSLPVEVPARPTDADAARANDLLTSLFQCADGSSFPYSDPSNAPGLGLSVSMAALITAILRPTLGPAPAFLITAPAAGTGKSTLANLIAVAATGDRAVAVATGAKPEEFEKSLGAALITGRPLISLDNLVVPLAGQLLATSLTEPTVTVRLLGLSKDIELRAKPTILATGNNARVAGDLARRTLMIRLDAKMERPEQRRFEANPIAEVLARRSETVSAALTIVRWHLLRRDPVPLELSFAGFDRWSQRIRAPLVALGHADPALAADLARASDDDVEQLRQLMYLWAEAFGDAALTASQAVERAFLVNDHTGKRIHPELAAAIAGLTRGDGKPSDGRRLGNYLRDKADKIVDGRCFRRAGVAHQAVKWQLTSIEGGV